MDIYPSGWTDPEELSAREAAPLSPEVRRDRWAEAVRGGRALRFFATDPHYAHLPLADRLKYAQDVARADWPLLYLR